MIEKNFLNSSLKAKNLRKNILQSLEPFIQTSKGQLQFFGTEWFFNVFLEVSQIRTIIIQIGKNNWDLETYRKS